MTPYSVGVIQFPGSNCEYETARVLAHFGCVPTIIRWNETELISTVNGYVLPGGFSFQDRVRSGVMAAHLPIMTRISDEVKSGKPLIGICNGCQILAESGLLSESKNDRIEVGMSKNTHQQSPIGFVCDWVYVRPMNPQNSPLLRYFSPDDVLPIATSHAEGHFVLSDPLKDTVSQTPHWVYCDESGQMGDFPITPNGGALAGITAYSGRVLGMMPHPERAIFDWQRPWHLKHRTWQASWEKLMVAFRDIL